MLCYFVFDKNIRVKTIIFATMSKNIYDYLINASAPGP